MNRCFSATRTRRGLAVHRESSFRTNPLRAAFGPAGQPDNLLSRTAGLLRQSDLVRHARGDLRRSCRGYGQSLSRSRAVTFYVGAVGVNSSLPIRKPTRDAAEQSSPITEGGRLWQQRTQVELATRQDVRNALQGDESTEIRRDARGQCPALMRETVASATASCSAGTS